MKKGILKFQSLVLLAMMTMSSAMTVSLTSCSNNDNIGDIPSNQEKAPIAKAFEGEWILEQKVDGIDALDESAAIYVPEQVDQIALLYHFYNDGTGWKELNALYEGNVEGIILSRYDSKFNYTVDILGKVSIIFTDAEGKANGKQAELKFDGVKLTDKIEDVDADLTRATDAQIKKYQEEADSWHGGADSGEEIVDLSTVESNFTALSGMVLTGKLKANLNVSIAADAVVTLKDVTIDAGPNQPGIISLGEAIINVEGENNVKGAPGVTVQYESEYSNRRLIIKGNGKLNATGYDNAAGIGSAYGTSCARFFLGANINAVGGKNAAGIGSGMGDTEHPSYCGDVYLCENEITATGGENAAGIGSGYGMLQKDARLRIKGTSYCSTVIVRGASVKAIGGTNCPGIGIGNSDEASNDIFCQGPSCSIIHITAAAKKVVSIKGEGATYSIGFSNCHSKRAINDIVFGRTPWFSDKFKSAEYENALKESPFIYPKD